MYKRAASLSLSTQHLHQNHLGASGNRQLSGPKPLFLQVGYEAPRRRVT